MTAAGSASAAGSLGADVVNIFDTADQITATTVEGALAEHQVAIDALESAETDKWVTFNADTGTTAADVTSDSFTITGGTEITTAIVGDVVTISYDGQDANDITASLGVERVTDDFRLDLLSGGSLALTGDEVGVALSGTSLEHDGTSGLRIATTALGNGLTGGGATTISVQAVADKGITVGASGIEVDPEDFYNVEVLSDTTTPDGTEDEYPIASTEQSGLECVYVNGVLQNPGASDDYQMAAGTGGNAGSRVVAFVAGNEPVASDTVTITYMVSLA